MLKIFIAENIPSLNKGEMTILDGMLESFRILGDARVSMLSARSEIDEPRYISKVKVIDICEFWHLNCDPDRHQWDKVLSSSLVLLQHLAFILSYKAFGMGALRFFKSNVWEEYLTADVIIEGHNGTFGIGGGFLGIPYLYPIYLPIFAKILNKPIVFYGGSYVQPRVNFSLFANILNKLFLSLHKIALRNIDLITLRESISYQNLKAIGLQGKFILVTADPALLLQPASSKRITEIMMLEGIKKNSGPLIGITVTRRIASRAFPQFNNSLKSYDKHNTVLAETIDNLIENLDANVIFVPHCIGFGEKLDDRLVARDIFQKCRNKQNVMLIENEYNAAELKGLIGQFDLLVGERLHSVVNAMSMTVPSVVICSSTDQRSDIIRLLGQDNSICDGENLGNNALLAKINDIYSKRDKIKEELRIQTKSARNQALLNGRLLNELLDSRKEKII